MTKALKRLILRILLSVTALLLAMSNIQESAWAKDKKEHPGKALERLGARVGIRALAVWPWLTPESKKLQHKNRYSLIVIGTDWKGGVEGLKHVAALPGLRGVMFSHPDFADDWCKSIAKRHELKEIYVQGTKFTDNGVKALRNLKKLQALSLCCTSVTDKGLVCLGEMSELNWLSLACSYRVTDKSLVHLRNARNLTYLNLDHTQTTGDGLANIKKATKLEWLRASGVSFIGDGPEPAPKFQFVNAGILHLMGFAKLKCLSIGGMETTETLMESLLSRLKYLQGIETSHGLFTRKGWQAAPSIREKLKRVANKIQSNIKE